MKEREKIVLDVVNFIEEKKGEETIVLDVRNLSTYTDFLVITTGNSDRQISAIRDSIEENLRKKYSLKPASIEGEKGMSWLLMDFLDFIVHIFLPETRAYYRLEELWDNGENRIYP